MAVVKMAWTNTFSHVFILMLVHPIVSVKAGVCIVFLYAVLINEAAGLFGLQVDLWLRFDYFRSDSV